MQKIVFEVVWVEESNTTNKINRKTKQFSQKKRRKILNIQKIFVKYPSLEGLLLYKGISRKVEV